MRKKNITRHAQEDQREVPGTAATEGAWRFNYPDLEAHRNSYWPMPNEFVVSGGLARLWNSAGHDSAGSGAAIGLLPVIGMYTNTVKDGIRWMGQEQMATLTGMCVASVRKGGEILEATGFGRRALREKANGQMVSTWSLGEHAVLRSDAAQDSYFSFPARAVYGGNWSRMSAVQKSIYLAVAAHVRQHKLQESEAFIREVLYLPDAKRVLGKGGRLMLTTNLSYPKLGALTGISRSAIANAVATLPGPPHGLLEVVKMKGGGRPMYIVADDFTPVSFPPATSGAKFTVPDDFDMSELEEYMVPND